ncbi:MAG TPA: mercury methylation ferredoxin HgcB [Anaerolineae bacterium]|jgi:NAD-dependent dihydropyrimidine dehydrogenase PreA subunit|nr:mercury methylation ferredoxin HgcB [Anaerolineae bacterium]
MIRASELNTLQYDADLCIGCEMCVIVCPHGVFSMAGSGNGSRNAQVARLSRPDACMECGACQLNCPTEAIAVESGVGCAAAMIRSALTGQQDAACDMDVEQEHSCCG